MPNPSLLILRAGKFDTNQGSTQAALDATFQQIRDSHPASLVIHFHGGLVDRQAGIAGANALDRIYRAAGAYPMFFIWESGWKEVLETNLPAIFNEGIFRKIHSYITRFAKGKIDKALQTGIAKAAGPLPLPKQSTVDAEMAKLAAGAVPFAGTDPHALPPGDTLTAEERAQLNEAMSADPQLDFMVQEIAASITPPTASGATAKGATVTASTKTLMTPDLLAPAAAGPGTKKGLFTTAKLIYQAGEVLAKIVQRFVQHRDHGFHLTVVEEILRGFYIGNAGQFLWDGMKTEIDEAFGSDPDCGGTRLLDALAALWKAETRPKIFLVGHSAGAIYVSRFLQEVQNRSLPSGLRFEVVLIAPACNFQTLRQALQIAGSRVTALRVFGMGDERERQDAIVKVVYPSSLLYLVSGVLEEESDEPLAGMQRFYGDRYTKGEFPAIDYVRATAAFQNKQSLIWSLANSGDGLNCDMTSHGGWAGAPATVKSVQYILEKGYGDSSSIIA
jgi:hypothetical protein